MLYMRPRRKMDDWQPVQPFTPERDSFKPGEEEYLTRRFNALAAETSPEEARERLIAIAMPETLTLVTRFLEGL